MPVGGIGRDPDLASGGPQTELAESVGLDETHGREHQGVAQIPVVVGGLRGRHTFHVDTVNASGHLSDGKRVKAYEVYGDSAYADGATLAEQTGRGHDMRAKVPPVRNPKGYSKDRFGIDLDAGTVTCPAEHTVAISTGRRQRWPASVHCVGHARYGRGAPQPAAGG